MCFFADGLVSADFAVLSGLRRSQAEREAGRESRGPAADLPPASASAGFSAVDHVILRGSLSRAWVRRRPWCRARSRAHGEGNPRRRKGRAATAGRRLFSVRASLACEKRHYSTRLPTLNKPFSCSVRYADDGGPSIAGRRQRAEQYVRVFLGRGGRKCFPGRSSGNDTCFCRYRENPECCFLLYSGKTPLLGLRFFIPARVPARGGFLISAKTGI